MLNINTTEDGSIRTACCYALYHNTEHNIRNHAELKAVALPPRKKPPRHDHNVKQRAV